VRERPVRLPPRGPVQHVQAGEGPASEASGMWATGAATVGPASAFTRRANFPQELE